jgi:MSHA pilin protein MshC
MNNEHGFTLIESIVVIILLGIISVYAIPRLDISGFRESSFFYLALTATRYAQKQAVTAGCTINVDINATGCFLSWVNPAADSNCPTDGSAVNNPAFGKSNFCDGTSPASTPTNGNFRFDKIGRPTDTSDVRFTSSEDIVISDRTITIEAETGFAYEL